MSVDAVQLANQSNGKLHHDPDLSLLPLPVLKEHVIQQLPYECAMFTIAKVCAFGIFGGKALWLKLFKKCFS